MGFYQSKLNTYSKFVKFNPEEMAHAQRHIISSKEKSLEQSKEDLRLARRFHLEENNAHTEEQIYLMERELAFIKTLDVVDFYQYLINVENFTLVEMLNDAAKTKNEYDAAIERTAASKGKITAGLANRRLEKLTRVSKREGLTIGLSAESMAEWKGLIPDDQVIYIMGRYEMERKASFDKEGFEQYRDQIYKLQHIKDEQSNETAEVEKQ